MKSKKIIAMILCAAMLVAVLTACGGKTPPEPSSEVPSEIPQDEHDHNAFFDVAFAAFAPDTVMVTADKYTVTWEELFYYIRGNVVQIMSEITQGTRVGFSWSDIALDDMTYSEAVLYVSADNAMTYKAVEYGAELNGISLSSADYELLQQTFDETAESNGGTDEFLKLIWQQSGVRSKAFYDYLLKIDYMATMCFEDMYGVDGKDLSDEEAAMFTASDGYLMAKHILRLKSNGEEDALAKSQEILSLLDSYEGDDFETFFDELILEHGEDPGAIANPNGYLFQDGDMVPEFHDACVALEIGDYSGVVETDLGYHILLRLPVNYDETPTSYITYGDTRSLRNVTALMLFDSDIFGWVDSLEPQYTDEYNSIDVEALFAELFSHMSADMNGN